MKPAHLSLALVTVSLFLRAGRHSGTCITIAREICSFPNPSASVSGCGPRKFQLTVTQWMLTHPWQARSLFVHGASITLP